MPSRLRKFKGKISFADKSEVSEKSIPSLDRFVGNNFSARLPASSGISRNKISLDDFSLQCRSRRHTGRQSALCFAVFHDSAVPSRAGQMQPIDSSHSDGHEQLLRWVANLRKVGSRVLFIYSRAESRFSSLKNLFLLISDNLNRPGTSNFSNVISQILLCKTITPDFNAEEICSIAKDSEEIGKILQEMQEFMPQQENQTGITFPYF